MYEILIEWIEYEKWGVADQESEKGGNQFEIIAARQRVGGRNLWAVTDGRCKERVSVCCLVQVWGRSQFSQPHQGRTGHESNWKWVVPPRVRCWLFLVPLPLSVPPFRWRRKPVQPPTSAFHRNFSEEKFLLYSATMASYLSTPSISIS